jgi:capsule polysaccharide export protein KpsE/RkpR
MNNSSRPKIINISTFLIESFKTESATKISTVIIKTLESLNNSIPEKLSGLNENILSEILH